VCNFFDSKIHSRLICIGTHKVDFLEKHELCSLFGRPITVVLGNLFENNPFFKFNGFLSFLKCKGTLHFLLISNFIFYYISFFYYISLIALVIICEICWLSENFYTINISKDI